MATTTDLRMESRHAGRIASPDALAGRLEDLIERRARSRIRDVFAVCSAGRIILRGRARTQHAKQVALEAVLDLTGGRTTLCNQIVVS